MPEQTNANQPQGAAEPKSRIRHTESILGRSSGGGSPSPAPPPDPNAPVQMVDDTTPGAKEIRAIGGMKRHEDEWTRTPNTTGEGAIHVRTFHSKLTADAFAFMDQQVNEWLDAHPQYEVKFVSANIGTVTGKIKEPQLVLQVWV